MFELLATKSTPPPPSDLSDEEGLLGILQDLQTKICQWAGAIEGTAIT